MHSGVAGRNCSEFKPGSRDKSGKQNVFNACDTLAASPACLLCLHEFITLKLNLFSKLLIIPNVCGNTGQINMTNTAMQMKEKIMGIFPYLHMENEEFGVNEIYPSCWPFQWRIFFLNLLNSRFPHKTTQNTTRRDIRVNIFFMLGTKSIAFIVQKN